MYLPERLRQLREIKQLSQGDIEKRTGLFRCHVSRVENGHTIPSLETLEKIARALEVSLYQLFYEGDELPQSNPEAENGRGDWASRGRGRRTFQRMREALSQMSETGRSLLLDVTRIVVKKKPVKRA